MCTDASFFPLPTNPGPDKPFISAELIFPLSIHILRGSHDSQNGSEETGFEGLWYKLYSLVKPAIFHFKHKRIIDANFIMFINRFSLLLFSYLSLL